MSAEAEWEVLAVNDLGEQLRATPAFFDDRIYVRTESRLYSFRKEKRQPRKLGRWRHLEKSRNPRSSKHHVLMGVEGPG